MSEWIRNSTRASGLGLVTIALSCAPWLQSLAFADTDPGTWFLWAGQPGSVPRSPTDFLTQERKPARGRVDGPGLAAQFDGPGNIAVDGAGNLYVLDQYDTVVRKVSANGVVSTLARLPDTRSDIRSDARAGIVVNDGGTLYVSEPALNRIVKISADGAVSVYAGMKQAGRRNGPAANALFSEPRGLGLDKAGNLYIADAGNSAIRRITPAGAVTTVAGSRPGLVDGPISTARFDTPSSVAIDKEGNIYIGEYIVVDDEGRAEATSAIRRIGADGNVTTLCEDSYARDRRDRIAPAAPSWGDCANLGPYTVIVFDSQGSLYRLTFEGLERIDSSKPDSRELSTVFDLSVDPEVPLYASPGGFAMDHQGNLYSTDPELADILKAQPPYAKALRKNDQIPTNSQTRL